MKKILLPLILAFIVVATSVCVTATQASSVIVDDTVNYATPTVDGVLDDAYLNSLQVWINSPKYAGVDTNVRARVYALYDNNYVYVFYQVENDTTLLSADDDYIQDHPNPSHNDAVELRIGDDLEEHLPPYTGSNAAHHHFYMDAYGKRFSCYEDAIEDYVGLMNGASKITSDTSYNVEMAIPVANPFHEGDIIQFNFQVDDCQDAEAQKTGYIGLGDNYMQLTDFVIGTTPTTTIVESGKCGNNVTWTLDSNGSLRISGNGEMTSYDWSGSTPWYTNRASIKSVIIEKGITSIGGFAFSECPNLTSIEISDSVTTIGYYAFHNCTGLTAVTIPDNVTSMVEGGTFKGCTNLKIIKLGNGITEIGDYAFEDCTSLMKIDIPDSITNIGINAFNNTGYYNTASNWTDGVLYAEKVLIDARNTISGAYSVKSGTEIIVGCAFQSCADLTNIVFPDSLKTIGAYAFEDCSSLTNIDITYGVTSIGAYAFRGCTNLSTAKIPNSLKSLGRGAFFNCSNLSNIAIPHYITSIGKYTFMGCTSLTNIRIPINSVNTIGESAFSDCTNLTKVEIPDSVTNIDYGVFNECPAVTIYGYSGSYAEAYANENNIPFVVIPKENIAEGIIGETISWVIKENGTLKISGSGNTYDFNKDYTPPETAPWYEYRDIIESVVIEEGITHIGNYSFSDCTGLKSITLPDTLTSIGKLAFDKCSSLESVTLPDKITSISPAAFYNCTGLKSIIIPDSVTVIGTSAFYGCTNLENVDFGKSVEVIATYAFRSCTSLTSINLPESVKTLYTEAFDDCTNLSSVTLGRNVSTIERYVFNACPNLTIHGYSESYAETYANQNEIPFVAISEEQPIPDNIAEGTISETINWVIEADGALRVSGTGEIPSFSKTITPDWYTNRALITSIIVEDGITGIGDYAFYNLENATTITIADSVYHLGQYFMRATGIEEITLNSAKEIVPYAFASTPNLKTIIFSENTKNFQGNILSNGEYSYTIKAPTDSYVDHYVRHYKEKYTSSLVTLTFESTGNAKYPVQHFSFAGDNVFFVIYQKAADNWAIEVTGSGVMKNFPYISDKYKGQLTPMYDIAEYTNNERIIKSIKVYDGVTTIGNYSFYKCNKATNLEIPDNITSIGAGAFWACAKITEITIPETVTRIGKNAFNGCANLVSVTIPDSITEIGGNIFIKCNTSAMTVYTENPVVLDYLDEFYPEINVPAIHSEEHVRVVGTKSYSLNGASRSALDNALRVAPVNEDGSLGRAYMLTLAECGLEIYENKTDSLIGLDVELSLENGKIIPGAVVLGTLTKTSVSVSDDLTKALIDGVSYTNLNKLVYSDGAVTTTEAFTELSDLKHPNVAFALDCEGDGIVDAIAVDYIKLAKVIKIENVKATATEKAYVKYHCASDVTATQSSFNISSSKLSDDKMLSKGDVFVYAKINNVIYVEEIVTPVTASATKVTSGKGAYVTLADIGAIPYVDGADGSTYLKDSGSPLVFDPKTLLAVKANPLDYYIYNNHIVAAVEHVEPLVYYPALLLYVKVPTDPIYNSETKKIEVFYPAVLLVDGKEKFVNLNKENAIDGYAATDSYVRAFELGSDKTYHNIPVYYTTNKSSDLYSLHTTSSYRFDARLIKYCAERSAAEQVNGNAYYSHLFLDFNTMKNGSQTVDTDITIQNGAVSTNAGYFYAKDDTTKKYIKITVNSSDAVKIANVTDFDLENGVIYLDSVDFPDGITLDDSFKVWGTANHTAYTYKVFDTESFGELFDLATTNDITLEAAVGTYVDENGTFRIAWVLVDNYYYVTSGDTEVLTQTKDLIWNLE